MRAGTNTWIQATIEMTLYAGDTIKTSVSSKTKITFFEGSTVELEASTEIVVAALAISETGSTNIELTQLLGRTISRVNKLTDSASNFNIETPSAIAAVRGSVMTVTVATNGNTVVTNEEGDIRVIVAGTEYPISEGMQRTIAPGEQPSAEVPIVPPGGYPPVRQARLEVTMHAPAEAHTGEVITYTYSLQNTGDLSFNSITASNDVSEGVASYQSGDTNFNELLDPYEIWSLTSTYTVQSSDYPLLTANGTISATTSTGVTVSSMEIESTTISPVVIASPLSGATVNLRALAVAGFVIDPAFSTGNISVNGGEPSGLEITEGNFNDTVSLADGDNSIMVIVYDEAMNSANDSINVHLDPYGMRIELTWDTGSNTDLDAHFIRPGSVFNDPVGDCYYNLSNRNPDWGIPEVTVDNPYLNRDDFDGYGPETITLMAPYEVGSYSVMVHYYSDNDTGLSANATMRIYINEVLKFEDSRVMVVHDIWDCAIILWPEGTVMGPPTALPRNIAVYLRD
jgi:uncharacterized repeat protein (TIGR01451 family)